MKTALLLALMMIAPADDKPPAAMKVSDSCYEYADTHVLVRTDVMEKLDKAHTNLGFCVTSLDTAQADIGKLEAHGRAIKDVVATMGTQQKLLDDHITRLESLIQRQNDYIRTLEEVRGSALAEGWENIDGMVGLGIGYALGAGTAIGFAWVFNQPRFGGGTP